MADTTTYFGNAVPATYPDGGPIIVNGRPLLLPQNFDLRTQINAARFQSTQNLGSLAGWFYEHYAPGSSGDPQRQAGYSGGFDPTYTDGGNYGYGLSAAAAGLNLDLALLIASNVNFAETGKPLPLVNERAIRQAYGDYVAKRFPDIDHEAGKAYIDSVSDSDAANAKLATANVLKNARADIYSHAKNYFFPQVTETDVQRYAKAHWGDLNSPDAQAFMANFQQAFGSYPQHLDLDLLHPLPADGSIPNGKDVSLFVGRNGEVLTYARTPAPGGTGALRGIYGLDGGPNGVGSTGMNFFRDGTPQPASVLSHPTTPSDPTGGIDVTLPSGAGEHWWYDRIDGFIRRQQDYAYVGRGYDTPSERLGHLPSGAVLPPLPENSPTSDDRFGNRTPSPDGVTTPKPDHQAPDATREPMRYLSGRIAGASGPSPFETGAPAVPFVSANDWLASAPSASSNDQFANRVPSPSIAAPPNSDEQVAQSQAGGAAQRTPQSVRVLSGRPVMPNSSGAGQGRASTPGISEPTAQSGWPPATRPVPGYPIPPMVYGLPDPSAASGNNMDDWFDRWIKPLMQQ